VQLHHTPGWVSRVFQAVVRWPDHMTLWEHWESIYANAENPSARQDAWAFYQERRETMDAGAVVLWPSRRTCTR